VSGALLRYRVLAHLVGTLLVVLVFVAVPLHYLADSPGFSRVVSVVHGYTFMVYLLALADLARRMRWRTKRLVVLAAAGVVPFLSFVVERKVTREVRARVG
jgi:integral membrane protein